MVIVSITTHDIQLIGAYQRLIHDDIQAGLMRSCGLARAPCAVPEGVGIIIQQVVQRSLLNLCPQGVELRSACDDGALGVGCIHVAKVLDEVQCLR